MRIYPGNLSGALPYVPTPSIRCPVRRVISRLLLVLLAVAVGVVVWRMAAGGRGGAVVALDRLHAEQLRHEGFTLTGTARLAVDAVGSFEERPDTALAALGWIVRRSDGAVVWRQRPGARPARGLVSAVRDTLVLPEGAYDAYFASFGDPLLRAAAAPPPDATFGERVRESLSRGGRAWQGEAGRWRLVVTGATPADRARARTLGDDDPARTDAPPDVVWASGPLGNNADGSALLRVSTPADVRLDAVFESATGAARGVDGAALVRVGGDGDTVWTSRGAASAWAGGALKNRRARATVRLAPGLYRASAHTDASHAAGSWTANPPFAPWTWGLTVRRAGGSPSAVAVLDTDPLADEVLAGTSPLPVVAEMRCVGTDQTEEVAFTLTAPAEVLLVAQGEVTSDGEYDVATLLRGRERVWEMTRRTTEPAGGNDKNRRASVPLSLAPGEYVLRYTTDGTYDCTDDYNDDGRDDWPDAPDFWGAAVVLLDPSSAASVRRAAPRPPSARLAGPPGDALVAFARVGNDARLSASFALGSESELRVVGLGELLTDDRLDYGWIEDAAGDVVWEMTRRNTRPAGGGPKNRLFDGTVTLGPGRYTAHYVSNGRHAYGAFEDGVPDDAEAWGLRVESLGRPPERL